MFLRSGARLGVYEVLAPLGSGGMGEVYRARDTRLNRDVALKVLPELFGRDPDRLARFKREAQLLASLNHPHIAAIYGFEEGPAEAGHHDPEGARSSPEAHGGANVDANVVEANVVSGFSRTVQALVLELVEGPTLAEKVSHGSGLMADGSNSAKPLAMSHREG